MSDMVDDGKRDFLKQASLITAAAGVAGAAMMPSPALAQVLETGVRDDSVLAKCRKEGVLRVGYAQTGPWFYKDAKTGELNGVYKDVVEQLAKELQVKVEWKEVTFANATIALRKGDFDLFGSSLTYLVSRAIAVDFVGPYYSRGSLLLCHKDNADKFKTAADANKPDVTFSVTAGASEEPRIPLLFPARPKVITTTGQISLGAEPVRAKKADVWISGDVDVVLLAKRNDSWAHAIDPGNPLDRRPNTLAIRYGDPEWKSFMDFYGRYLTVNGEVERLLKHHVEKLGGA
ncbi:MAG: transporter substrate-binding domain-containing protein [Alphaproteobacteria bacterium]